MRVSDYDFNTVAARWELSREGKKLLRVLVDDRPNTELRLAQADLPENEYERVNEALADLYDRAVV